MSHVKKSKLPPMKIKKYWGSPMVYIETDNRNGNNVLMKIEKGPVTQRGKHFYYLTFGHYKSDRLKTIGVDLVE